MGLSNCVCACFISKKCSLNLRYVRWHGVLVPQIHTKLYTVKLLHMDSWELQPDDHAVKVLIGERTPRILRWPF